MDWKKNEQGSNNPAKAFVLEQGRNNPAEGLCSRTRKEQSS